MGVTRTSSLQASLLVSVAAVLSALFVIGSELLNLESKRAFVVKETGKPMPSLSLSLSVGLSLPLCFLNRELLLSPLSSDTVKLSPGTTQTSFSG